MRLLGGTPHIAFISFSCIGIITLRFANIFKLTNVSVGEIWEAVRKVKFNESLSTSCGKDGLYFNAARVRLVKTVEQELGMNRTEFSEYESEPSFQNMTAEHLKTAAEFFIYLNACPHTNTLKSLHKLWADFYADLFGAQSPDHIILTLNRITHQHEDEIVRNRNKKLLKRVETLLSLKFKKIQSLLPGMAKFTSLENNQVQAILQTTEGNNYLRINCF